MARGHGHRTRHPASRRRVVLCVASAVLVAGAPAIGWAQPSVTRLDESTRAARTQAAVRAHVGIEQRVDVELPDDVTFQDEHGETVRLGRYFDGSRPVVLNFAYYSCPVVCDLVLREAIEGLSEIGWSAGEDYRFVSISIDPRDDSAAARATEKTLLELYGRPADDGFHFLTGNSEGAKLVADAVGWTYDYLPVQEEYAHPAALVLVTPEGRVSRYLLGLRYQPNDLRVGLLEASEGRGLNVAEQAVVYCYRYDPDSGGYVVVAERVMRIGGAGVAIVIAGTLGWLWRRELMRRRAGTSPLGESKGEAVRTS